MARRCLASLTVVALFLLAISSTASAGGRLYAPSYGSGPPEVIGGFALADDGSLTPLAGSPFAAYPGPPFSVAGLIRFAFGPDGSTAVGAFLFNGGVQGMAVGPSGVITPTNSVVTRQSEGLAVSPDGRFAYEATREYPPGNKSEGIRVFSISTDGSLTSSGEPYDAGASYGEIAISPNGRFLFGNADGGIKRFTVNPDGSLTYLGMTTFGSTPTYLTTSPDGRFLFVGDTGGKGGVASFSIGTDGSLTPNGEPALTGGTAVELFAVSPDGSHVYMPDEGQAKIVVAVVAPDGKLTVTGSIPVEDPEVAAVSPDGRYLYWQHGGPTEGIAVAAIGADGMPTVLPFNAPWKMSEPVRLDFRPGPAPVASFTAKAATPGAAAKFDAAKSSNAGRYAWSFGDGTTLADGGPAPEHVYARAGKYTVTLSLTDASGCGAAQIYTGQSTACPGGASAIESVQVDTLPVLSKFKVTNKKFVPRGVASAGKRGTTFRFRLNEKAKVSIKIERKIPGRKVGGKCKKKTAANSARKRCPLFKRLGSRTIAGKPGANELKFNGKLKGVPLEPGAYRATAIATDSAKGRSGPKRVGFKVLG